MKTIEQRQAETDAFFAAKRKNKKRDAFSKNFYKKDSIKKNHFNGPHWIWKGPTVNGSPIFNFECDSAGAKKAAFELYVGEVPEGANITSDCHNPLCVNPKHFRTPKGYTGDFFFIKPTRKRLKVPKTIQVEIAAKYKPYQVTVAFLAGQYELPEKIIQRIIKGKQVPVKVEKQLSKEEAENQKLRAAERIYRELKK